MLLLLFGFGTKLIILWDSISLGSNTKPLRQLAALPDPEV
jgi:hypothetical protein